MSSFFWRCPKLRANLGFFKFHDIYAFEYLQANDPSIIDSLILDPQGVRPYLSIIRDYSSHRVLHLPLHFSCGADKDTRCIILVDGDDVNRKFGRVIHRDILDVSCRSGGGVVECVTAFISEIEY